jgi:hypothetical protein
MSRLGNGGRPLRTVLALSAGSLRAKRVGRSAAGGRLLTPAALAVLAFAVATAFGLAVVGGLHGFLGRAANPTSEFMADYAEGYVVMAWAAVVLLVVPVISLGAAAARLGVSRRDERLSTLRLLGVTPREVVGITLVETAEQGLVGAGLGVLGYFALLPVWTRISFMGDPFDVAEWVGWQPIVAALVLVPLVAAVSGAVSLRRVVVSPLGVARRQTPPGVRWIRLLGLAAALGAFAVATSVVGGMGVAVGATILLTLVGLVLAALNLVGPWTISVLGRVMARRARTPARLLAARRILDDPKGVWRVLGGLGLAAFVAGVLSLLPSLAATEATMDPDGDLTMRDMLTGGMLTLAIAFTVASASAGIMQAATVLDRRREYALQRLAGVPAELFDSVRRREVLTPLVFVLGTSVLAAWLMLLPLVGLARSVSVEGVVMLAGCLLVGCLLFFAATEASRPLMRSVLRETVVRVD